MTWENKPEDLTDDQMANPAEETLAEGNENAQETVQEAVPTPVPMPPMPVEQQSAPASSEEMVSLPKSVLQELIDRIEAVEKGKNPIREAKKRYTGPREFSFKLRGWVPVLSYQTTRKDPTKWLRYKNQFGHYTNNQLLKLSLADKSTVDVDVEDFLAHSDRSEKMRCQVITDENGDKVYKFNTDNWGEFTVLEKVIN